MASDTLRKCFVPACVLAVGGCTTPAPFPLLGEAERCIRTVGLQGESPPAQEAPLERARALLGSARRESDQEEARHFAHLSLQQCRTAHAIGDMHRSEERIDELDLIRVHLESALRVLQAKAARTESEELAHRLGIADKAADPSVAVSIGRTMFLPGGCGLRPRAAPLIGEIAEFLRAHRQWQVNIAGATSTEARRGAASVRHSLVARGLEPERIGLRYGLEDDFVHLVIDRPH